MKMIKFAKRNTKEILRDPLTVIFGLGFPLVLLFLLNTMQNNIPTDMFEIKTLTPGIAVFGQSFVALFSATLVAKDRESSLLRRLYTSPLTGIDFIVGYMLSILPIALGQTLICYLFAIPLGLNININIVYAIIGMIPMTIFNISLGILCGILFNVKQVGGVCGALLTNLSAWLSGVWFDLKLMGDVFALIAEALPFVHAVRLERYLLNADFKQAILPPILIIIFYTVFITAIAVLCFLRHMKNQ